MLIVLICPSINIKATILDILKPKCKIYEPGALLPLNRSKLDKGVLDNLVLSAEKVYQADILSALARSADTFCYDHIAYSVDAISEFVQTTILVGHVVKFIYVYDDSMQRDKSIAMLKYLKRHNTIVLQASQPQQCTNAISDLCLNMSM